MMKTERVLWRVAIASAVLLLFAQMTPRTSWTKAGGSEMRAEGGGMTHSAGWDLIAPLSGGIAVVSLLIGRWLRPGTARPVLSAAIASLALATSAAASLAHWLDLNSGALEYGDWMMHPAPALGFFAAIALAGLAASLLLLGTWLRPSDAR